MFLFNVRFWIINFQHILFYLPESKTNTDTCVKLFLGFFGIVTVMQLPASVFSCTIVLFPSHKTNLNTDNLILNQYRHTNMPIYYEIYVGV